VSKSELPSPNILQLYKLDNYGRTYYFLQK